MATRTRRARATGGASESDMPATEKRAKQPARRGVTRKRARGTTRTAAPAPPKKARGGGGAADAIEPEVTAAAKDLQNKFGVAVPLELVALFNVLSAAAPTDPCRTSNHVARGLHVM